MKIINRYSLSLLLRFSIVFITDYLENIEVISYTDIDYSVFTDGARHILKGESPYLRETYRYSPIMAYLMIFNITIHRTIGKIIFSIADVLSALIIELILFSQTKPVNSDKKKPSLNFSDIKQIVSSDKYKLPSLFQLLNPLSISICTRGSSDSITIVSILLVVLFVERNEYFLAGIIYGFIIHFRIYPVIYSLAIFLYVLNQELTLKIQHREVIHEESDTERAVESDESGYRQLLLNTKSILLSFRNITNAIKYSIRGIFKLITHKNHWMFAVTTILSFMFFNIIFYKLYENEFLNEALLYHFIRKDHRHNFSIYNYMIYLTYNTNLAKITSLLAFLPQAVLILVFSVLLSFKYLNLCLVVITTTFVHFNKVVTAQYFLWYFSLFPLIITNNGLFKKFKGFVLAVVWLIVELIWNYFAHELEYNGKNKFVEMYFVEAVFFIISIYGIKELIKEQM
jgi:phosphatidylinositol glycan class M